MVKNRLRFRKSYNMPNSVAAEHIDVLAENMNGDMIYTKDGHYVGTPRDYSNTNNMLAHIDKELATAVSKFKWPKDMSLQSVMDAIEKYVDPKHEYDAIDKKIADDISQITDMYDDNLHMAEYSNAITSTRDIPPKILKNILTGKSTIATKLRGLFVNSSFLEQSLEKLIPYHKKRFVSFCQKHDFNLSDADITAEMDRVEDMTFNKYQTNRYYVNYDTVVARCVGALLIDALYNEYYKRTGDNSIFFGPLRKQEMHLASDSDLIAQHGKFASQYYQDAIMITERMKIKTIDTLPKFLGKLYDVFEWNYVNQDIMKTYVDIIYDMGYNKFKMPAEVKKFLERMVHMSKNTAVTKKINQMLVKKQTREQINAAKEKVRARLSKRATELQNGEYASGTVVANEMAGEIIRARRMGFNVAVTPETAKKLRAAKYKIKPIQASVIKKHLPRDR